MKGPEKFCLHLMGKMSMSTVPSINSCSSAFDAALVAQSVLY